MRPGIGSRPGQSLTKAPVDKDLQCVVVRIPVRLAHWNGAQTGILPIRRFKGTSSLTGRDEKGLLNSKWARRKIIGWNIAPPDVMSLVADIGGFQNRILHD